MELFQGVAPEPPPFARPLYSAPRACKFLLKLLSGIFGKHTYRIPKIVFCPDPALGGIPGKPTTHRNRCSGCHRDMQEFQNLATQPEPEMSDG